jgi:hypothetical protein
VTRVVITQSPNQSNLTVCVYFLLLIKYKVKRFGLAFVSSARTFGDDLLAGRVLKWCKIPMARDRKTPET